MAFQGYPLAKITEREVIGDQANQTIQVNLHLESGPPVLFGNTSITGLKNIDEEFIQSKIAWNKDDPFNPIEIEKTQTALEATGLFSSINISHAKNPNSNHSLPMFLEVVEAKHRSISAGLAYNTERGPGFTAEWEHRNIRNMGEKLRLGGTFWAKTQKIKLIYIKPDWMCPAQDLAFLMEGDFEKTRGYRESAFSITPLITRQINEQLRISYGVMYKALRDTSSIPDGNYNLLKAPFSLRWSDANNLLDATIGKTLHFKCIPSWQFIHPRFAYCINELTLNCYQPITEDCRWMIASKVTFGSIWGSSRRTIPASERFYEGSENSLRGYRYLSVSPLCDKKPIGGRSMILYNAELRWRATETIGLVGFYDVGNVYAQILPNLKEGVLQSTGAGIRYHTPVGPLRLDFAIPLNRRKGLDSPFQIYFSIGQAF